ncbi:MAG: hypothetical protein QOG64_314 [Acidimicrobiaceae bacterium]|nr:hypothetical protein [Acidimicrobiaceae bacterium]
MNIEPSPSAEPVLVTVGDIACTQHSVITPSGHYRLSGSTWIVTNQTTVTERIPPYAIVLAILFALACLLGLLFLLIKEKRIQGFMQVSVQGPGFYHATQIPVSDHGQAAEVEHRVGYIRNLVAALPPGA